MLFDVCLIGLLACEVAALFYVGFEATAALELFEEDDDDDDEEEVPTVVFLEELLLLLLKSAEIYFFMLGSADF